jgi:hypothetical protein
MTLVLAWLAKHWRLLAIAGAGLLCVSLLLWFGHSRYAAGEAAGRAHVQKLWEADRAAQEAAYGAAVRATNARIEADRKVAEEVERDLQTKLAAADASGRDLGRRLSDYIARARRCAVPPASPATGVPDAPGAPGGDPEARRAVEIDRAVEDTLAECKTNATDLDAWFEWAERVTQER